MRRRRQGDRIMRERERYKKKQGKGEERERERLGERGEREGETD